MNNTKSTTKDLETLLDKKSNILKLTQEVIADIANCNSIEEKIEISIQKICELTSWDVGHTYLFDEEENKLISSDIWYPKNPKAFTEFKTTTKEFYFKSNVGLIIECLKSKKLCG